MLVEKWIFSYYPLFEHERFIPQLKGERAPGRSSRKLSFREEMTEIVDYYRSNGGISVFSTEYRKGTIPRDLDRTMRRLVRKVRIALTDQPMRHLGYSQHGRHYSVFDWDRSRMDLPAGPITPDRLVQGAGKFSIPPDLDLLFQYFGSFITGEGTLLGKWADFTVKTARDQGCPISRELVLDLLGRAPDTTRQVQEASRFYHQLLADSPGIACAWSGMRIHSHQDLHVDHVLPFSLWKNNDFWNLMPTHKKVNEKKRDMIPSPALLERRKDTIRYYWQLLHGTYGETFRREIVSALAGTDVDREDELLDTAFANLVGKCA